MYVLNATSDLHSSDFVHRASVQVKSSEITGATLHVSLPWWRHLYTVPFLVWYPVLAYAYYVKYDDWLKSEEWTFLACVTLGVSHALSYLFTRWNTGAKAWITTRRVRAENMAMLFINS